MDRPSRLNVYCSEQVGGGLLMLMFRTTKEKLFSQKQLQCQGFIQRGEGGGGWNFPPPPPPPEILKLSVVIILAIYMLLNISMCHQNVVWKFCPRLRQKQSERTKIQKFPGGACPQTPLVGTHAFRTLLSSCYHPVFPPQLKILYETLSVA